MRIAVINTPFSTHIGRLAFVFQTLHGKGHEIELWGSGDTGRIAQRNGFTFRELPLETDFSQVMQRRLKPHDIFNELFFRIAKEQLDTVLAYCERYSPDVLEGHNRVFSATVASMLTGIPVVTHSTCGISLAQRPEDLYGFCVNGTETPRQLRVMRKLNDEFFRKTDAWFDEHIAMPYGLGSVESAIGLCAPEYAIAQTIRELSKARIAALPNVRLVGPIVDEEPADTDFARYRPYCYVSLGTSPWSVAELVERYRTLARHVPKRFNLVVGLGGLVAPSALGVDDPRVTVFDRAPQIEAIKHSEFVICHGGCQTVHEALYFGKPLIGIPHHAEINEMVNSVELNGAGVRLAPRKVGARTIEDAVDRVSSSDAKAHAETLAELLRAADGHANSTAIFEKMEQQLNPSA